MCETKKYLLVNIIISALIGAIVGLLQIVIPNMNIESLYIILYDTFIGLIIGAGIKNYSIIATKKFKEKYVFIGAAIILAVISILAAVINNLIFQTPIFTISILVIIIIAEMLGLSWTYYSLRQYQRINEQLKFKKDQLDLEQLSKEETILQGEK